MEYAPSVGGDDGRGLDSPGSVGYGGRHLPPTDDYDAPRRPAFAASAGRYAPSHTAAPSATTRSLPAATTAPAPASGIPAKPATSVRATTAPVPHSAIVTAAPPAPAPAPAPISFRPPPLATTLLGSGGAPSGPLPSTSMPATITGSNTSGAGGGAGRGPALPSYDDLAPPAQPPAAPSRTITTGGGADTTAAPTTQAQLAAKVRYQATELANVTMALANAEAYRHTLERRLLEIVPDHPIPVQPAHLGLPPSSLSKLAVVAAVNLVGNSGGAAALNDSMVGGGGPGSLAAKASHIMATANAATRREAADTAATITRLEKGLNDTRARLTDAQRRLKESRQAMDAKEKEKAHLARRCEAMQQRIVSLEAEMRLAGLQPSTTGPAAAGALGTGTDAEILMPGMGAALTMVMGGADAAGALSATVGGASGAVIASRLAATGVAHNVPVSGWDDLLTRVRTLEVELAQAQSVRDKADEALRAETRSGEEARAYIAALEKALQMRLLEHGLPADTAQLVTAHAKLSGEVTVLQKDVGAKADRITGLEAQVRQLTAAVTEAQAAAAAATAARRGGSLASSGGGVVVGTTPVKHGGGGVDIRVDSPKLGTITRDSHAPFAAPISPDGGRSGGAGGGEPSHSGGGGGYPTGAAPPSPMLERLEAEKAALLDYIAEHRDSLTEAQAQVEALAAGKMASEAQVAKLGRDLTMAQTRASDAEAKASSMGRQVTEAQSALASCEARVKELSDRIRVLESTITERENEAAELRSVQAELLATIRDQKKTADSALAQVDGLRSQLDAMNGRHRAAETTLDHVEGERDAAERRVRELQDAVNQLTTRVAEGEISHEATAESLRATQAELADRTAEVAAKQQTVDDLTSRVGRLQAQLAAAEAGSAQHHGELAVLRKLAHHVTSTEAAFVLMSASLAEQPALGTGAPMVDEDAGVGDVASPASAPASARDGRTTLDAGVRAANMAARAGRHAQHVADEAASWVDGSPLAEAAPGLATAIRRVVTHLKTAGTALIESAHTFHADAKEKRQQRHLLYEEIHALRAEVTSCTTASKADKERADAATAAAAASTARLDTATREFESRLTEAKSAAGVAHGEASALREQLMEARGDNARLSARVETLTQQLQLSTKGKEDLAMQAAAMQDQLAAATTAREEVTARLSRAEAELSAAGLERRAVLDRTRSLEAQLADVQGRCDAAAADATAAREALATAQLRVGELTNGATAGAAAMAAAKATEERLRARVHRLKADLAGVMEMADQQNVALEKLQRDAVATQGQATALQRSVAAMSMEVEAGKEAMQDGLDAMSAVYERCAPLLRSFGLPLPGLLDALSQGGGAGEGEGGGDGAHTNTTTRTVGGGRKRASTSATVQAKSRAATMALASAVEVITTRFADLVHELTDLHGQVSDMRTRIDAVNDVATTSQERARALAEAEGAASEMRSALAAAQSQLAVTAADAAALRLRLAEQHREHDKTSARLAAMVAEVDRLKESETRAHATAVAAEGHVADLEAELAHVRREADSLTTKAARLEAATNRDGARATDLASDLAAAASAKARADAQIADLRGQLSRARQDLAEARNETAAARSRVAELERQLAAKEVEVADLRASLEHWNAGVDGADRGEAPGRGGGGATSHTAYLPPLPPRATAMPAAYSTATFGGVGGGVPSGTAYLNAGTTLHRTLPPPASSVPPSATAYTGVAGGPTVPRAVTISRTGSVRVNVGGAPDGSGTLHVGSGAGTEGTTGIWPDPNRTIVTVSAPGATGTVAPSMPPPPTRHVATTPIAPPRPMTTTTTPFTSVTTPTAAGLNRSAASVGSVGSVGSVRSYRDDVSGVGGSRGDDGGPDTPSALALQERLKAVQARFQALNTGKGGASGSAV